MKRRLSIAGLGALAVAFSMLAAPTVAVAGSASPSPTAGVKQKPNQKQNQKQSSQTQTTGAYPNRNVTDLATGKAFNLSKLAAENKPTLLFIWAPS